ncbi:hypothetical protein INT45_005201 [Circinella minor]|uniref:Uncharacterized protein n=1 Tax=Circinella minor TaxID=1195481 RepID=A0A8H7RMH9_9FUNG|nr:hypothetical protein INT45_005201 [Circinella minor]
MEAPHRKSRTNIVTRPNNRRGQVNMAQAIPESTQESLEDDWQTGDEDNS